MYWHIGMWLQIEWYIMIVNLIITNSLLTIHRSNFIYNLSCWIWSTPIKCVAVSIHSITKDSEIPTNKTTQFNIIKISSTWQVTAIYILKYHYVFLEIPYGLTWVLNFLYTSQRAFNTTLHGMAMY